MRQLLCLAVVSASAGALAGGCDPTVTVTADDVIPRLAASPDTIVADGAATTEITVGTVGDVVADLEVSLTIDGAAWLDSSTATISETLGPDGTATATVVAPRIAGSARVTAEIAGYQRELAIGLVAAVPDDVVLSSSGNLVAGALSQIQITAEPTVASGLPTARTAVRFHLETEPPNTGYLTAERVLLDATATTAATAVVAGSTTTRVTVTADATPPGAVAPAATSSALVIVQLP